jgi:hypothetical protein
MYTMFHLRNKLHAPISSSSLIVATRPKAEENVGTVAVWLLCILQNFYSKILHIFRIFIIVHYVGLSRPYQIF